jgi:lipopolysaccharide transport system ATP-binding protein
MAAILGLCQLVMLLDSGRIVAEGFSRQVVDQYLQATEKIANLPLTERSDRQGNRVLTFLAFELTDSDGLPISCAYCGQDVVMALKYRSNNGTMLRNVHVAIGVHGRFDENLFHLSTSANGLDFEIIPTSGTILCRIPQLPLQPGRYSFNLFCTVEGEIADWIENAGVLEVESGDFFGFGKLPPLDQGVLLVRHTWDIRPAQSVS